MFALLVWSYSSITDSYSFHCYDQAIINKKLRAVLERRQFLKSSVVTGIAITGIGSAAFYSIDEIDKNTLTVSAAIKTLNNLPIQTLESSGQWSVYQIFSHCAQSIEFSMSAFPQHKSRLFKRTLGHFAFRAFESKGQMTHSLNEPIPGAPVITESFDPIMALNRLIQSLIDFDNYHQDLAPHFAYGELTKREYEIAHVMHLNNHLQEIRVNQLNIT